MKVLLTGAAGQLGQALFDSSPEGIELIPTSRGGGQGVLALDLVDGAACRAAVLEYRPDWLLNAGAYTAVDRAESEPDLALAVNAGAPQAFAEALVATGGRLLQVSTDFVFNGRQGSPYLPEQARDPLGVYGLSKARGEEAVEQWLGGTGRGLILRTGWLYGPRGRNFCTTILRLHRERAAAGQPLAVVSDQVGCPTSIAGLAAACWRALGLAPGALSLAPVLHWSDAGVASWYDFAVAIGELGVAQGLLEQAVCVQPLTSVDYPTPARRPNYSLLECSTSRALLGLEPEHWRTALAAVLRQLS